MPLDLGARGAAARTSSSFRSPARGRAWGIVLRGQNVLERVRGRLPGPTARRCRADGPPERLRRIGARINVP